MNVPSPSPPTSTAIAAMPTVIRLDTRMPAMITGQARGSRICTSCRALPMPMPLADSMTAGETPSSPVTVLRRMGRIA